MRWSVAAAALTAQALTIACSTARTLPAAVEPHATPGASEAKIAEPSRESTATPEKIPNRCDQPGGDICAPPAAFAKRLCDGSYPDVALAMFAKGTPWTRAYLSHEVEAWNAAGGRASSAKLELGEEVIVLVQRAAKGGVQVGVGGNYDVLRWDGSCASLMADEITRKHPPKPKYATIKWRNLDVRVRDALLADPTIEKIHVERRKECKTSLGTEPSASCAKVDARLSLLVVERVLQGASLPLPEELR